MIAYLEMNESLPLGSTIQPLTIRIEVTDKNDALAKLPTFEPFFAGKYYTKKVHYCNHDTGGVCTEEIL